MPGSVSTRPSRSALVRFMGGFRGPWTLRDGSLLLLCPVLLLVTAMVTERVRMRGHVMPGVELDGRSVTGLSRAALLGDLAEREARLLETRLEVRVDGARLALSPVELFARLDRRALTDELLAAGRRGGVLEQVVWRARRLFEPVRVSTQVEFEPRRWEELLVGYERALLAAPREADLVWEEGVSRIEPEPGHLIRRDQASEALSRALREQVAWPGTPALVSLELQAVAPQTSRAALDVAERRARVLLSAPVVMELKFPSEPEATQESAKTRTEAEPSKRPPEISYTPAELGPLLRLRARERTTPEDRAQMWRQIRQRRPSETAGILEYFEDFATEERSKMARRWDARTGVILSRALRRGPEGEALEVVLEPELLEKLLQEVRRYERAPLDARFVVDHRQRISIEPSRVGTELTTEHALEQVWRAAEAPSRRGSFEFTETVQPRISTQLAESLNVGKQVASFTTRHPCCRARVKNIHRIADLVNGTVVLPGETFSLNEHIGPRTRQEGFFEAPTIVHGEMSDTFGGGISQFTTTLYNAVFDAGYAIIERQPHSYYFPRYPMGHEATLSYPKPDLIFKNDTQSGLLIVTEYGSTYIRVKLFGDNEGRKVERGVSEPFDHTEDVEYVVDDELSPDEAKVEERGSRGFSVTVSRIMTDASGEVTTERRKVTYNPRVRVIRVHSCNVPLGEEGHTGDECPEPEPTLDGGVPPSDELPDPLIFD